MKEPEKSTIMIAIKPSTHKTLSKMRGEVGIKYNNARVTFDELLLELIQVYESTRKLHG